MLRLTLQLFGFVALCTARVAVEEADLVVRSAGGGTSPPCSIVSSVQNGDFETCSLDPWSTVNGTTAGSGATVVSRAGGSGHAAQLNVVGYDGSLGGEVSIAQLIQVCKATNYSITFDYNPLNVSGGCSLAVIAQSDYSQRANVATTGPLSTTGGWQTVTISYPNYVRDAFFLVAKLQCQSVNDTATAQVDNFSVATIGTLEPDGCPGRVLTLPNGGFESGDLPPWRFQAPTIPKHSIVSPGYNSNYALQISVPQVNNYDNYILQQYVFGQTCLAYRYKFTFAVNWGNYSYTPNTQNRGCNLYVSAQHCSDRTGGGPYYYPTAPNSGWHEYSYTCLAGNSASLHTTVLLHCAPSRAGQPNPQAFDLMVDSFTGVQVTGGS